MRLAVWIGLIGALSVSAPQPGLSAPTPPTPPQRSLLAQAFGALDVGNFERVQRISEDLERPLLKKAVEWYRLVEQRRGGHFQDYLQFMESNPTWPWQYTLQYRAEGVMPRDMNDRAVRDFFEQREPASPYGAVRYVDARISAQKNVATKTLLQRTWVNRDFPRDDARHFYRRYRDVLSKLHHRQRLERLLWEGHYSAAERQMKHVGRAFRLLARARIKLARMESGVDATIDAVPAYLRDHPGLVFERARWRKRKGRYADTAELLDPPRAGVPHPERWWPIRHWLARTALNKGDISRAYRVAAQHDLEKGLGFAQGEWLAGWISLRFLREPQRALEHFANLYDGTQTPVSQARGAYWAGRAARAASQPARARRWFETAATNLTTFYGQLAAARLRDELFLALAREPKPTANERHGFQQRELVRAVRLLHAHGQNERVDPFVRALAERTTNRKRARLVADLAKAVARPDLAVAVARDFRRRSMILPTHLYPDREMPVGDSDGFRVDQSLLLAIARQESSFDTNAISPAGAYGLMQLMPATARDVAERLDIAYNPDRLRGDPDYNLRLGSAYIDSLIRRYDGSLLLAVAAYNAGPGRVDRWLRQYGDPRDTEIGPIDWIESIPFSETRNYVQRVFESYMIYRHRVAPTRVALALDGDHMLTPEEKPVQKAQNAGTCCS